jgi:hypothetical protein
MIQLKHIWITEMLNMGSYPTLLMPVAASRQESIVADC